MKHLNCDVLPHLSAVRVTIELPRLVGLLLLAVTVGAGVSYKATDARNKAYHAELAAEQVAAVIADVGMQAQYETEAKSRYAEARKAAGGYTGGVDWAATSKSAPDPRIAKMQAKRQR